MWRSNPHRRIAALAAIYVVVLQALLLPLAVAAGAPNADSLCITAATDAPAPGSHHDTGCACAAGCGSQCCAQGVLGAAPGMAAIALTNFHMLIPAVRPEPFLAMAVRSPQNPRAPPAA